MAGFNRSRVVAGLILMVGFTAPASADTARSVVYEVADAGGSLRSQYEGLSLALDDFLPLRFSERLILTNRLELRCSTEHGPEHAGVYSEIAKFVRDALASELFDLGAHASDSQVRVSGNLSDVSTDLKRQEGSDVYLGSWSYSLSLRSSLGRSASFNATHSFAVENPARSCSDMTDQFVPGVQLLVKRILGSEEFLELVNG